MPRGSRPGAPALYVAQAGLGSLQRSTGLVRGPGRAGGAAPGDQRGGPRRVGGLAPPWEEWPGQPCALPGRHTAWGYAAMAWWWPSVAGGDRRIPAGAVHGQGVDPAQQRRSAGGPGLGVAEPAVITAGQRGVLGGQHLAVPQHRPGDAPERQPQRGPPAPGDLGLAVEGGGLVAGRGYPGVLDQRGRRGVLARVAGFGQDRGQPHHCQAGIWQIRA